QHNVAGLRCTTCRRVVIYAGEAGLADGGLADIGELATQCRFNDCANRNEPGCALLAAIDADELDPGRVANYLKLREEIAGAADRLAQRMAQKNEARGSGRGPGKRPPPRPRR